MRYGWARTAAVLAMAAGLAACGRGDTAAGNPEAAENLREAGFFMSSNAKADGVQTLASRSRGIGIAAFLAKETPRYQ
mgnify:CR=1 FL=1